MYAFCELIILSVETMHQSIPAAPSPPPPGSCGAFACIISPGGGALANLARTVGRASANPWGIQMPVFG